MSTALAATLGIAVGAIGGYFRGRVGRRTDAADRSLPDGAEVCPRRGAGGDPQKPSVTTVVLAIGVVSWPATARLVRAEFLSLREREFVLAGETIGMGHVRLIVTQLLPNALPPVIAMATLTVATAIQTEASLAFLGLGDPNGHRAGAPSLAVGANRSLTPGTSAACPALPSC